MVGPTVENICIRHGINKLILGYRLRLTGKRPKLIYILYVHSERKYYTCNKNGGKLGSIQFDTARNSIMAQKKKITKDKNIRGESCVGNLFVFDGMPFKTFVEQGERFSLLSVHSRELTAHRQDTTTCRSSPTSSRCR